MFKCNICSKVVPPRIACLKRTAQTRAKHYPERAHCTREWREVKGKWKKVWIPDAGGTGWEIVSEVNCCLDCATKIDKERLPEKLPEKLHKTIISNMRDLHEEEY